MDSGHFFGLIGRSLFAEEYLGDLEAAGNYLQQTQPRTSEVEPAVYAEYLCCSAVYSVFIGRPADAYESLEALKGLLGQLPKEWGLRYTNYKVLADYTRRYPPLLRFYHEIGRPVNIPMLGDIGGLLDISNSFLRDYNTYFPDSLPDDQTLALIMNGVIGFPMRTRNLAARFHPLAVKININEDEDVLREVVNVAQPFVDFRDKAYSNGLNELGTYMFRLVVELHLASQSPMSDALLHELHQKCEGLEDYAGMANAKMLEADNLISPPFASPVTLNLVLVDVSNCTHSNALWDSVESDLKHEYVPRAKELYESALRLFRQANSKRGQAAVLLRQGCCLHNEARHERSRKKQVLGLLSEAEVKLQESLKLFGKDEANAQLVKTHLLLLGITRGNVRNIKAIARSIGVWGVEAKNEIMVHCIAIIMSRYAHHEWSKLSNMDSAFLAWECAFEVCEPVGDIITMFQSVVSRAYVHNDMLNPVASQIFIEEALSMVDRLLEYFDSKLHSAPGTPVRELDRSTLMTSKFNILWSFSRGVNNVYFHSEHLQKYNEWNAKLAYWIEHDESFTRFREKLENGEVKQLVHSGFSLPQKKMEGLWRQSLADDAAMVRYGSADFNFRRMLDKGDIIEAEASFRRFVDEAMTLEKGYCRDLSCVIACDRIGDSVKAREILDSIDDNDLFNGQLEEMQQGIGTMFDLVAENALVCTVLAGDKDRARRIIDMIIKIWPSFFEKASESMLDYSKRLSYYAQVMKDEAPEVCFAKLLEARQIIETRRIQTKDLDARIGSSNQGWATEVFMNLARICLRWDSAGVPVSFISAYEHGNFDDISWSEHALLFVEMSRARAVLESLQIQATQVPGMTGVPDTEPFSELFHKRRLLRSLLALRKLSPEQEQEVSQLRKGIDELERDGNLSYATTFIETVNSTIEPRLLYQSIDKNAVVIEATFASRGFISFAVTGEGIQKVHKGTTNVVDIRRPVMQAMQIMRDMTGYIGEEEDARKKALNQLSQEISDVLLAPFAEIIRHKSHVTFSVSDPMTAFPFASLVFDGKPLVMHAAVSQVPSLTVLHHLSQRESASIAPTVSVFARSPTQEPPEDASRHAKEVNLHMAGIEAINIARMFETWPIETSYMTREDFREYVKGGSLIMHIGTHGNLNYRYPLLSSISIGNGQEFRVIDMSTVRSSVHLLVFAACLSGLGKATIGSEVLGFSHVVLSTGCQAYIGSLWKVSDFGSMLIMTLFYRHLRSMPHLPVTELMRKAQMDILQLDEEKASLLLDDMLHNWTATELEDHSPAEFVPDAEFLLSTSKMFIDQLDWSSPFYWAPFTLVGYGGLRFVHEFS
ncbi:CHAT domain-containing protein [Aspergillus similis]